MADAWFLPGEPVRLTPAAREATGLGEHATVLQVVAPRTKGMAELWEGMKAGRGCLGRATRCPYCGSHVEPGEQPAYFLSEAVEGFCCAPVPQHWLWKNYLYANTGSRSNPVWAAVRTLKREENGDDS